MTAATPPADRLRRIAAVIPSINTCAEPELGAMSPPGTSVHVTRVRLGGTDAAALDAAVADAPAAVALLEDLDPDVTLFHCTAATTYGGAAAAAQLETTLNGDRDTPVLITATAVVHALRALGAERVALITPYDAVLTDLEAAFLSESGFTVTAARGLDLRPLSIYPTLTPEDWHDTVTASNIADADAVFISCTNVHSAPAISGLERALGVPVITSNQAALWYALRRTGFAGSADGYGRLFDTGLSS